MNGPVVQAGSIGHVSLTGAARVDQPLVPRQLPLVTRDFTGRVEHLATLDALLPGDDVDGDGVGAVVISAVDGTAGVGKTALAVHWAYRVQPRFPDGTLYVNLCGYGPGEPATPGEVLGGFLGALGIPPERIPTGAGERAGLYRSVLAERRVLTVLDNANAAAQVRPLLPGGAGCAVVVTSRDSLTGLVVSEGARRITLDVLTEQEALELVRAILGAQRADAEPEALIELIRACARLPLALRIAAGRAVAHPYLTVADLVAELRNARGRWEALSVPADEQVSVRAVCDWSYRRLTDEQARMFRRLGLHPGPEFSLHAAAAVAGIEVADAQRLLGTLADRHLIEPVTRDRYRFHDLLRAYAADHADHDDAADDREHARHILLEWYAHHARIVLRIVAPVVDDWYAGSDLETHAYPEIVFPGPVEAWAWADRECRNIVAAVRAAVQHGLCQIAMLLADISLEPLTRRQLWDDAFDVCHLGLAAARRLGDRTAEYHLLQNLAYTHRNVGQRQETRDAHRAALALARDLGNQWLQAEALARFGISCLDQGQHAEAERYLRSALPLSLGAQRGRIEGDIELYLSAALIGLGDYEQALQHAERSLTLQRQAGNPHGEAHIMHQMARARLGLGAHPEAIALCEQALNRETHLIDPRDHAATLDTLGTTLQHTGNTTRAIACWREALTIFDEFDDPRAHDLQDRLHALEATESGTA